MHNTKSSATAEMPNVAKRRPAFKTVIRNSVKIVENFLMGVIPFLRPTRTPYVIKSSCFVW